MSGVRHWEQDKEATVYIGNLDERVSDALVWELMLQAGRIVNVHLPKDRVTQTHQGFGFVEFISEEDAEYAARIMNQVRLYGKPIRVNKASADKQKTVEVGAELFVGNLDSMVDEKTLYDTFSTFGNLVSAPKIARDDASISKGFGFISYDSFEASDKAIENMDKQFLMNKEINVQYAYKKDGKGERHGDQAERLLAAQARKHNVSVPAAQLPPALFAPQGPSGGGAPPSTPTGPGGYRGGIQPPTAPRPPPQAPNGPSMGMNMGGGGGGGGGGGTGGGGGHEQQHQQHQQQHQQQQQHQHQQQHHQTHQQQHQQFHPHPHHPHPNHPPPHHPPPHHPHHHHHPHPHHEQVPLPRGPPPPPQGFQQATQQLAPPPQGLPPRPPPPSGFQQMSPAYPPQPPPPMPGMAPSAPAFAPGAPPPPGFPRPAMPPGFQQMPPPAPGYPPQGIPGQQGYPSALPPPPPPPPAGFAPRR